MEQSKFEQLKLVIQQANPEIMELKFGCEVRVKIGVFISKFGRQDNVIRFTVYGTNADGLLVTSDYDPNRTITKDDISRILGRPIRLADVLLAWQRWCEKIPNARFSNLGECIAKYATIEAGVANILKFWNLRDDNLDHQSEETKQLLINLLIHERSN